MLGDFTPLVYHFGKAIKIYTVSDLHIGAAEVLLKAWHDFKKQLLSEPDSYITISGDMMNNGIKNSKTNVYEETMRPRDQKAWLVEQLRDITDKILCVVPGNHEYRSVKEVDDNPLYDVCCKLNIEDKFRENAAILIIRMGNTKGSGLKNPTYTGCVIHGAGGGATAYARNKKFGYAFDGLDFLIAGHSHEAMNGTPAKIVIDKHNKRVTIKPFRVIIATAWLDYAGYAMRMQLTPTGHALAELTLCECKKEMKVTQ